MAITAVALFCEDIRQELHGTESVIGLLADTLVMANDPPGFMPKLSIYVRINFTPDDHFEKVDVRFVAPDGMLIASNPVSEDTISQVRDTFSGHEINGIKAHISMIGFQILTLGIYKVFVDIDGKSHLAGIMDIQLQKEPSVTDWRNPTS